MMEEDFYATIKLKTGEEIFAKVIPTQEKNTNLLLINNPIVINEIKSRSGINGYKIEPWLKTTTEDLFVLNLEEVLTMTESKDIEIIILHQQFVEKNTKNIKKKSTNNQKNLSRKMGYISNINDAKKLLEDIYKNS